MICYIILHYKNIDETMKCIDSLHKTTSPDSRFIIVDNGSGDGSGERLRDLYGDDEQCDLLLLPDNNGFSKGNNTGYIYAKEKFDPDFIVIANNDVLFYQESFEQTIEKLFTEYSFYVLGPDIYIPRHKDHQNPLFKNGITVDELKKEIEQYEYYNNNPASFMKRLRIHAIKNMLCSSSMIVNRLYGKLRGKESLDYRRPYENVGLQGSCLIFSKLFIDKEDKAFDPEPFLYEEEEFLFYRCRKKGYKMIYSPELGIRHEEGASINFGDAKTIDKLRFMLKHHVSAREELLAYLLGGQQE